MDAIRMVSDLHALKSLYGLLKEDGNGGTETLSELLDENARLLLKNMLDAEAKKILKVHSEMLAGQVGASGAFLATPQLQQRYSTDVGGSYAEDKGSGGVTKVGRLDINLSKDKRLAPQWTPVNVLEQSAETPVGNGHDSVKRRCRVCQRNTLKKLESMEEEEFYDAVQQNNESESACDPWNRKLENETIYSIEACEPNMKRRLQNKPVLRNMATDSQSKLEKVDLLSEEASKAIQQIEICIAALPTADHLQVMLEEDLNRQRNYVPEAKLSQTSEMNHGKEIITCNNPLSAKRVGYPLHQLPNLITEEINHLKLVQPTKVMPRESRKNYRSSVSGGEPSGDVGEWLEEGGFPHVTALNFRSIVDKIDPRNCITSYNDSRISRLDDAVNFSPASNPHETSHRSPCRSAAAKFNSTCESQPPVKDQISTCRLSNKGVRSENQSQMQHKYSNPNKGHLPGTTTRTSFEQQESEGSVTESYSSDWTSQQSNSYDYSWTDQSMTNQSGSASQTTGSPYTCYTTDSKEQPYSSASGDTAYTGTSSQSNTSVGRVASTSKKLGPNRTRKDNGLKHKKQGGTWKRLKDRLAIIFHHHHHHHHHKRNHDIDHRKQMSRKASLHKHRKRQEDEAHGERAVEKMTRSLVLDKKQHSHFRGLMEGFMRHVRSSKPSKPETDNVAQLTKGRYRRNRTLNKSHWWQLMQRQRRAKMRDGNNFKLRLGKKQSRLKALPG